MTLRKLLKAADLDDIHDELKSHQPTLQPVSAQAKNLSLNIVFRNLPESKDENRVRMRIRRTM